MFIKPSKFLSYITLSSILFSVSSALHAGKPVAEEIDPHLIPGFPVKALLYSGSFNVGPSMNTLIANIDSDPELEIIVSGLAAGPIYAWNYDGTEVTGWPTGAIARYSYLTAGNLTSTQQPLGIFAAHVDTLAAYDGTGNLLTGWPRSSYNYASSAASMGDTDGDGLDEIFICEEDSLVHKYQPDGSNTIVGGTSGFPTSQRCNTPSLADITGDGNLEYVYTSSGNPIKLYATEHTGYNAPGFPVTLSGNTIISHPVIGDVDGDGNVEIVVVVRETLNPGRTVVKIVSHEGVVENSITGISTVYYGTAPALADMDGDKIPEIIYQSHGTLYALKADGSDLPGFPVTWGDHLTWVGNSSPVIGDVDGDWRPDIIVSSYQGGQSVVGEVRAYNGDGNLLAGFPKTINIGSGTVPAIADIDLDGSNEIIISASMNNGVAGYYDKVWVYRINQLQHGSIQWSQFGNGPRHQGVYTLHPVGNTGQTPVANAGSDLIVGSRQTVTLDGSLSYDPDGEIRIVNWTQLSGPTVEIVDSHQLIATFTSPGTKGAGSVELIFELSITDEDGGSNIDQIIVTVSK